MKLQQWIDNQNIPHDMIFKHAAIRQALFVRDHLGSLVSAGRDERIEVDVISEHTSKSIRLPVYELARPDLRIRFILRENFYNWKLSVISEQPIIAQFDGLFHTSPPVEPEYTGDPLSPVYFEEFPRDLIFGYYGPSDGRKWSAELWNGEEGIWTTLFLIMRSVGAIKPFRWRTRESHKAELEAQSKRRLERTAARAAKLEVIE